MILDYFKYDYEFAEPPRVTSLQNVVPLATFSDFGDDVYFVADQRGYEAVVYYLAGQYLKADKSGNIVDPRLQLNKAHIYTQRPTNLHCIFPSVIIRHWDNPLFVGGERDLPLRERRRREDGG